MTNDPDKMMLELFRAEVESHSETLSSSLLKLEQDPEAVELFDGMMRAAHSIKGAARIVRVDAAVDVAHVMEDCFVAAQRGELSLDSSGIDVMLRSVDLLVRISEASKDSHFDWSTFKSAIQFAVQQLRCVLNHQPVVAQNALSHPESDSHPIAAVAESATISSEPPSVAPLQIPRPTLVENLECRVALANGSNADQLEELRLKVLDGLNNGDAVSIDLFDLQDLNALCLAWLHSAFLYARANSKRLNIVNASQEIQGALVAVGITEDQGA